MAITNADKPPPPPPPPPTPPPPPRRPPYPDTNVPPRYHLGGEAQPTAIWPEIGRFAVGTDVQPTTVDYHYGFSSTVGAGPYHRDLLGDPPAEVEPVTPAVTGGTGLNAALTSTGATGTGATGTVTIRDSLTYKHWPTSPDRSARSWCGPARPSAPSCSQEAGPWVFNGGNGGSGGTLVLDGLTVSRCDIVLRGSFDTVRVTACTIDPGTAAEGSPPLAKTVDDVALAPCRIFIESGSIGQLLVDHCILGPVRTRFGGSAGTLIVTDSIVQGLPATTGDGYTDDDVFDPALLARGLTADDPLARALLAAMPDAARGALQDYARQPLPSQRDEGLPRDALDGLNALAGGPSLYDPALFATANLSDGVRALAAQAEALDSAHLARLNRSLLDESFPVALGVAALAVAEAAVQLNRVTVLGRIAAHRLSASNSILRDFTAVDDAQDGCVRFTAYASGSVIPRHYESPVIPPGAPIFTSDSYGQPGYAQLLETADAAITGDPAGASICSGAENGSELGAFSADLNPVKEQGLLVKYAEYMPLGLTPVIVHVT